MKQTNFFPIERNRYFYGKLLTEKDFNDEQEYFNNKRRLINRLVHGAGIVSGLGVLKVDEKTVSVESGLAIDGAGREIVADSPSLRRLSMIEGYDKLNFENSYVYLCIEYDEEAERPESSPANTSVENFSKYHETYRLYLTKEEPNIPDSSPFISTSVLFRSNGVVITQKTPLYIKSGETGSMVLSVENYSKERNIRIELSEELFMLSAGGKGSVNFIKELRLSEGEKAEFPLDLTAFPVKEEAEGKINIERLEVSIDKKSFRQSDIKPVSVRLSVKESSEEAKKRYYEESFERVFGSGLYERLYLARIHLLSAADSYIIDSVEAAPFGQYVITGELIKGLFENANLDMRNRCADKKGLNVQEPEKADSLEKIGRNETFGTAVIDLGIGAKTGQRYYSGNIAHGLGTGAVDISLSVEEEDFIYMGDRSVFPTERGTAYSLCAKLNRRTGTFVIGARAEQDTTDTSLKICWSARVAHTDEKRELRKQLYILPEHIELRTYSSIALSVETRNLCSKEAEWKVNTAGGGSIDANGVYTAPGVPGIYEIEAVSKENSSVKNTAFIIVREQES